MRIDRIRVRAFGRLHDLDTGPESLEGLVVVLGPNEAGKSTLFTFLTTALYGFQPASRDRNPHVPWGADEAGGEVRLRLDEDGCAEIQRTLRSQPSGKLTVDGRTTDLRNQAVPWVGHVPRAVFRQVFAITLAELAGLDGQTWARIQDRMIGSMGAADLHSARAAAEALEKEAGEIWRPNRRGNQRLRDLQAELRALRARRAAAHDRDGRIRRLIEERGSVGSEIQRVRELRHVDRREVERARSLLPVKQQLERIATLREEAGPLDALAGLPPDPPARFADLSADLAGSKEARDRIDAAVDEHRSTVARAEAAARDLLACREDIVQLVARSAGCAPDRIRAVELEGEIQDAEARLEATASGFLEGSWRDVPARAFAELPVESIRERLAHAAGASRADAATSRALPPAPVTWLILAVGAALLAWGLLAGLGAVAALGAAAVAVAVTLRLTARRGRAPGKDAPAPAGNRERGLRALLGRVPVRQEHLAHPGEALVATLDRLRTLSVRRAELGGALTAARERVSGVDAAAGELARSLGRDGHVDAEILARDLDREVRDAERLQDAAASAAREVERLERERSTLEARADDLGAELQALADTARTLVPGDPRLGLQEAKARLDAHERADRLEEELLRHHPDLEDLRGQIEELDRADHEWSVDEEAVAHARARIEGHDERVESLLTRAETLDGEVARLRDEETVDAVDGEIAGLREEESRLVRERDRKWVLARLLREADRRFREEHQPDLIRRAGSYLEHLTGGRYERLVVDESDGEHLFHLVGPTLPAPVPLAPPVSTGTLEQAYLSVRLAIVDHLDQGGERLPLFVDEVFVNWDGERRARGLQVLAGIAGTRQVFVFTCHPDVAGELQERGGRILELDGL